MIKKLLWLSLLLIFNNNTFATGLGKTSLNKKPSIGVMRVPIVTQRKTKKLKRKEKKEQQENVRINYDRTDRACLTLTYSLACCGVIALGMYAVIQHQDLV